MAEPDFTLIMKILRGLQDSIAELKAGQERNDAGFRRVDAFMAGYRGDRVGDMADFNDLRQEVRDLRATIRRLEDRLSKVEEGA